MAISAVDPLPRGLLEEKALPLYGRTAAALLADIRAGGAQPGDRLPSERALTERYAVSRVTLRAALKELQKRRLVKSSASRGWFVGHDVTGVATAPSAGGPAVQGFADFAEAHGLATATRVLSSKVRPSTVEEAVRLRVAPGAPLFVLRRIRFLDGLVVVIEHNRLPLHLCPALAETDFEHASLYATLRRADLPQLPRIADYAVEARAPEDQECELLEIETMVPLLVATQLSYNQHGRPLELTVAAYRGDRYRFTASITNHVEP